MIPRVKEVMLHFNTARQKTQPNHEPGNLLSAPKSMVPTCGMFKINRDAVIDNSKKLMGVGMIVRDHEGKVLAPLYSLKQFIIDPTTAEAYAAWKAMKFSKDLGL